MGERENLQGKAWGEEEEKRLEQEWGVVGGVPPGAPACGRAL